MPISKDKSKAMHHLVKEKGMPPKQAYAVFMDTMRRREGKKKEYREAAHKMLKDKEKC